MGNRIPEETIEEIRNKVDIVDVISEYIQLKKQGRNYFGLCPFHGEKTPSFSVSADKQIYHCFGCGAGGNVFSFLMNIENCSFMEAAATLAEKVHINLPIQNEVSPFSEKSPDYAEMFRAHDLLQKFYHHLLVNTKEGTVATKYLQQRGFTEEVINRFKIGYAPNTWDAASRFLEKRGFNLHEMAKAGLIVRKDSDGTYFDRFRDRIMFPIWDNQGRTIAFGGRILYEGEPKYLNSPETKIFNKSKTLYGLHLARPEIRKKQQVILFEGYVDVIAAHRAGVENGVASLGTSLTDEQANIIRRNAENVTICYDSDSAGINAAYRAASVLTNAGCTVRVSKMPEGFDPDDYIRTYGYESFQNNVIGTSLTLMAFKIEFLRRGKNLQDEGELVAYIEEVLKEISLLPKAVERDRYLRALSEEFSISLDALKSEQYQIYRKLRKNKDISAFNRNNNNNYTKKIVAKKKLLPAYYNAERILLAHMLRSEDITIKVKEQIGCSFNIDVHNAIALFVYGYFEEGNAPDVGAILQRIEDEQLRRIVSELAMLNININISDEELSDYIKQVLNYPKWLKIKDIETEKLEALKQQDIITAAQLAKKIIELKKNLK
ncbi:DNA primase [Schinkia azotoformans]|uniref:DNA primase n=1 Tax=Schinkia azotoformans TaxID=1454 RepID=UPI002DB5AA83|nr:DNA primase [Schinkia azotoformans]MEC1698013.1 DNA primase [Schinkia azotoformans]MEC1716467.1 DNA primase [Schinkia azotoformans]MEC1727415.1 DNA primase [Schinkia azotoformans]MEC1743472.1 DNA primase [Schinkia azotoformans]MEC1746542.1 DNA primase [Schinkia azotoformans]